MTAPARIRAMGPYDLDAVCAMEEEIFPAPWSRGAFEQEVAGDPTSISWVAEADGIVVGYLVSWLVADELYIGNVAVARSRRSVGIGVALLEHALGEGESRGARCATLEVRVSNARAIRLYERLGFRSVAIRKRYYSDNREDGLVMMNDLGCPKGDG